jgi:phage terminase large subunit-like protein
VSDPLALWSGLRLGDGRLLGEAAEPWQKDDAQAILAEDGPRLHYVTRPRGGSKTSDLAAVLVVALLEQVPPGGRCYAFAVDRDQAGLLVEAVAALQARSPELSGALTVDTFRVTATHSGARLDVMAADAASAWGLRGEMFVVDEFAQWPTTPGPRRLWQAILSAVPKVSGARLVILTTAGDPGHPAHKVLVDAKASAAWRVHEVPGPVPWIYPEALAEQQRLLPESQFRRLHLNQWVTAEDSLVDAEDLAACVTLDGPVDPRPGVAYRIGGDLGLKKDRTAVAVCHLDGVVVVLDRLVVFQGTRRHPVRLDDVEEAVFEAARRYNGARVHLDPWQAVGLGQRLARRGVRVDEYTFSAQSVGRLASTLFRLLRDRHVALPDDEELLDELANVRLRETSPGVLRMEHDPDKHDDRAIALALAAFALVERPPSRGGYAVTMAHRTIGVDFGVPEPYELIRGDGSRVVADGDDWWSRNVGPYATGGA